MFWVSYLLSHYHSVKHQTAHRRWATAHSLSRDGFVHLKCGCRALTGGYWNLCPRVCRERETKGEVDTNTELITTLFDDSFLITRFNHCSPAPTPNSLPQVEITYQNSRSQPKISPAQHFNTIIPVSSLQRPLQLLPSATLSGTNTHSKQNIVSETTQWLYWYYI